MTQPQNTSSGPAPADIEYLRQNPQMAAKFDAAFGQGAAQKAVATPPEEGPGIGDYAVDMGRGLVRGALQAVDETSDIVAAGVNKVAGTEIEPLNYADMVTDDTTTLPGQLTEGLSQFVVGLAGLGKFTKLTKLDKLVDAGRAATTTRLAKAGVDTADSVVRAMVVAGTVFDPYEGNLANLVEQFPNLSNPLTDFMAVDASDSEMEARLKNAFSELPLGVPLDFLMASMKAFRAVRSGRADEAEDALAHLADMDDQLDQIDTVPAAPEDVVSAGSVDSVAPSRETKVAANDTLTARQQQGPDAAEVIKKPPIRVDDQLGKELGEALQDAVMDADVAVKASNSGAQLWDRFYESKLDLNLGKIVENGGDEVRAITAMMDTLGAKFRTEIDSARNGERMSKERARETAGQFARQLGAEPGVLLRNLAKDAKDARTLASRVIAYEELTVSSFKHLESLARMVDKEAPGAKYGSMDNLIAEYARHQEFVANILALTRSVKTGAARATAFGGVGARVTPRMMRAIENGKVTSAVAPDKAAVKASARAVAAAGGDPRQMSRIIHGSRLDAAGEVLQRFWTNSILSGPATHLVNIASNLAKATAMPAERMLAGVYSLDPKAVRAAAQLYVGQYHAMGSAFRAMGSAFKVGRSHFDDAAGLEIRGYQQVPAEDIARAVEGGQWGLALLKSGEALINLPTRLLGTTDAFFKEINYQAHVASRAWAEGVERGLKTTDLDDFITKRVDESYDPTTGSPLDEDGMAYAAEGTFTQALDPHGLAGRIQIALGAPGFSASLGRMILPFVKTPANVLADWAYRSGLHGQLYRDLSNPQTRSLAAARLTVGAGLYGLAASLIDGDSLTGMGPQNPEVKKLWKADGKQPYSVKIGDAWYSYNRTDPFGMFLGIAADLYDIHRLSPDREGVELTEMAVISLARNLSNKTYLRGMIDFFEAMGAARHDGGEAAQRWMRGMASGFVPAALTAFKDDPYLREVRSTADAIMNRTPGYAPELDPSRNVLGEPVLASEAGGYIPVQVKTDKPDPVAAEIARVFESTGEELRKPAKKNGEIDYTQWKNSKGQSAYDRLMELHAELGLRERLRKRMQAPGWDRLTDAGRVEAFRAETSRVRTQAHIKLAKEFPELATAEKQQKRLERMGLFQRPQ